MAKEEKKDRYELGEVATQTQQVIVDTESDKTMSVEQGVVLLLNKLEEIESQLK